MTTKAIITKIKLFGIYLLLSNSTIAQTLKKENPTPALYKNAIYGSMGCAGWYFSASGFYERLLKSDFNEDYISTFFKVGYGGCEFWEGSSEYYIAQYGMLTGTGKRHLELSGGVVVFNDFSSQLILPSATIGYRRQKPNSHYIFRTGVSWPEAIYVGWGFSF